MATRRTSRHQLKRYQLQWRPSFPATKSGGARIYVLGEKLKYTGENYEEASKLGSYDLTTFGLQEIIRVAYNSTLILPLNSSIALAQEYSPSYKNKIVQQHTLGGNSVTTFGAAIKKLGLRIRIIKAGNLWQNYVNGLEALAYLSANQGRFYGGLYFISYDTFEDGTEKLVGRYKVTVESLDFQHRSETNTTVSADLQMVVLRDYGHFRSAKNRIYGSL